MCDIGPCTGAVSFPTDKLNVFNCWATTTSLQIYWDNYLELCNTPDLNSKRFFSTKDKEPGLNSNAKEFFFLKRVCGEGSQNSLEKMQQLSGVEERCSLPCKMEGFFFILESAVLYSPIIAPSSNINIELVFVLIYFCPVFLTSHVPTSESYFPRFTSTSLSPASSAV